MSPEFDPTLLALEGIATRGGDRGPHYDQGVLHVIRQIRQTGTFKPSPFTLVSIVHDHPQILTPEEKEQAQRLLRELGLSAEDGAAFGRGIEAAESDLRAYRLAT